MKSVRKVESVDRDANMGLERNRNLRVTTSSTREPSDIFSKLLQQQAAPEVDTEYFNGNPFNYHYFIALFSEVVETKIDGPRGRLTRLIKYTREPKELIKHCIQPPHDHGYQTAVTLGKNLWESSQDSIIISKGGKGMVPDQIWQCQSIPKVLQLLVKV